MNPLVKSEQDENQRVLDRNNKKEDLDLKETRNEKNKNEDLDLSDDSDEDMFELEARGVPIDYKAKVEKIFRAQEKKKKAKESKVE